MPPKTKNALLALLADRKGVTAMEYGVIAAAIVLAVVAGLATMGGKLTTLFSSISGSL